MNGDEIFLTKTLHHLIEQFLFTFENYIEQKKVDKNKAFCELLKRNSVISREIRAIATHAQTNRKATGLPVSQDELHVKICKSVHKLLQQDFVECALNSEDDFSDFCASYGDLHSLIYRSSVDEMATFMPTSFHVNGLSNFPMSYLHFTSLNSINEIPTYKVPLTCSERTHLNIDNLQLPTQFAHSVLDFESELVQLGKTLKTGFPVVDPGIHCVFPKLEDQNLEEYVNDTYKHTKAPDMLQSSTLAWPVSTVCIEERKNIDFLEIALNFKDCDTSYLSWEGRMKQCVPNHLFTSEWTTEEFLLNTTDEDPQIFQSLYSLSGIVSEDDMVYDILDLLIGIPSSTFLYDDNKKSFQLKPGTHLFKLSYASNFGLVEDFIESGIMFCHLENFCNQKQHNENGLVMKGLHLGIKQILSLYKEYIVAVKTNNPSIHLLRTDVLENAQLINTLGAICGINSDEGLFVESPKGLGLLSQLNQSAWSHKRKDNSIMIAVLLKYAYTPYLNFLNKWMVDGVCLDPYEEFQIIEDSKYLNRKDDLFWKFAYTENEEDPMRIVPAEIQMFSRNILECGKSTRLLKMCCPKLYSWKFMSCNQPPPLSMVFSFPAAMSKSKECTAYILCKEKAEQAHKLISPEASKDEFHIARQMFVDRKYILKRVEVQWHTLLKSSAAKSNMYKNQVENLKTSAATVLNRRWNTLPDLNKPSEPYGFSGILYNNIGLLYSSCGYFDSANDYSSGNLVRKHCAEVCNFHSSDFSKQLCLQSYTQAIPCKSSFQNTNLENRISSSKDTGKEELSKSNIYPGSFSDRLSSLLLSEYEDTKEDIYSCLQVTSLQNLMLYNFSAVLKLRISIVEKTVKEVFVDQLKFCEFLLGLRNTYLLQDEGFSQTLCEQLFDWVLKCESASEFANWIVLNEMLNNAVSVPTCTNISFLTSAGVTISPVPEDASFKRFAFLRIFRFEFRIDWPLNIIVHRACIAQYMSMFSMLLEMEYLCWLLGKIWRSLLTEAKLLHLENMPQYREVMLHRFDMDQFIRVVRNGIHEHLWGPLWEVLMKDLCKDGLSIDVLESIHLKYLEKALARCFLTDETNTLHELINVMFHQVNKFCNALFDCCWELNPDTGQYETPAFTELSAAYEIYKGYQKVFYKCILRITVTKKVERPWDDAYRHFLDTILDANRNIS